MGAGRAQPPMVTTLLRRGLQALPIYLLGVLLVLSSARLVGGSTPVHAAERPVVERPVPADAPVHFSVLLGPLPLPVLLPAPIN